MVEGIVDGGMDVEKTLRGSRRLESLHLALSSPHDLMGVFSTIVFSEALIMRAGQAQLPGSGCTCGAPSTMRGKFSTALNEHVETFALMVDGAPQVHPLPG